MLDAGTACTAEVRVELSVVIVVLSDAMSKMTDLYIGRRHATSVMWILESQQSSR